jgi:hypothetical protein
LFTTDSLINELDKAAGLAFKIYRNLVFEGVELTPEVRKMVTITSVLLALAWLAERIHTKTLALISESVALKMIISTLLSDELLEELEKFDIYGWKVKILKKLREIDEKTFGILLNILFEILMLLSSKYLDWGKRERLKKLYKRLKEILEENEIITEA